MKPIQPTRQTIKPAFGRVYDARKYCPPDDQDLFVQVFYTYFNCWLSGWYNNAERLFRTEERLTDKFIPLYWTLSPPMSRPVLARMARNSERGIKEEGILRVVATLEEFHDAAKNVIGARVTNQSTGDVVEYGQCNTEDEKELEKTVAL